MRCNYRPPKLSKEDRQELASLKSTLPYIDRMQIERRNWCEVDYYDDNRVEVESNDGNIQIGDEVGTIKGRGVVSVVDNDIITVNLNGDHGCYCFSKDSVWKMCRCDTCLLKNLNGIVPSQCEWYRDNVTFGNKSADECPYYKPIENNI